MHSKVPKPYTSRAISRQVSEAKKCAEWVENSAETSSNDHDEKNAAAAKSNHLTMARKLHGSVYRERARAVKGEGGGGGERRRRRKEAVGSASTASLLRKPTSTMCEVSAKSGRSPVLLCTGR